MPKYLILITLMVSYLSALDVNDLNGVWTNNGRYMSVSVVFKEGEFEYYQESDVQILGNKPKYPISGKVQVVGGLIIMDVIGLYSRKWVMIEINGKKALAVPEIDGLQKVKEGSYYDNVILFRK